MGKGKKEENIVPKEDGVKLAGGARFLPGDVQHSRLETQPVLSCCLIFLLLLSVHSAEALLIRTDETVFGENFINKLFGILVLSLALRHLHWSWEKIGFAKRGVLRNMGRGFLLAGLSFLLAYGAEFLILRGQGQHPRLDIFITAFSLTGESAIQRGAALIALCVFFNLINVIMEEGCFRGLFLNLAEEQHSPRFALLFQALLFGLWHLVTPLRNLLDGDMDVMSFVALSIGYIILAGLMGIKWGLLYRMTGSLYAGMADHFFNNCIATNLLHVCTVSGVDEWLLLRVLTAQLFSFTLVLLLWRRHRKK